MTAFCSGEGEFHSGTGAITPTCPPHVAGDILLLIVHSANEPGATPSGWTAIRAEGSGTAGAIGSVGLETFYFRATNSSTSNPTVADRGDHTFGIILNLCDLIGSGDPVNAQAGNTAASSTSVTIPAVTTTVPNCLVVDIVANAIDASGIQIQAMPGATNANLDRLTRKDAVNGSALAGDVATQSATGTGGGFTVFVGTKATAGDTGTTTATLAAASVQARIKLAFTPASSGSSNVGNRTRSGLAAA